MGPSAVARVQLSAERCGESIKRGGGLGLTVRARNNLPDLLHLPLRLSGRDWRSSHNHLVYSESDERGPGHWAGGGTGKDIGRSYKKT